MALKAILLDAGETLFRVRGSVGVAYAGVAARHGVTAPAEELEARFRAALRRMPPLSFPGARAQEIPQREYAWWRHVAGEAFAGYRFSDFDAFFRDLFEYFADAAAWELFPDTEPALAGLQARGLRLGIVSNFDGRLIRICEGLRIAPAFNALVMSGRVGYAKPDPRIFAIALARLGVTPAEAAHVGDSEREDLAGAEAAGLRAVLIQRTGPPGAGPERISDLGQLIALCATDH
jgi:putative hydrolase of the HAD superfamily